MHKILISLALAVLAAGPLAASENADVVAAIQGVVDAFNKGDTKAVVAASTDEMCIIDEFPPYEWHGAGACAKWASDYEADSKKNEITDGVVKLGTPRHVDVVADRAYVVAPASYAFKMKGKRVKETNSTLTLALQKEAAGWRITGWTWSKH